jgi:Rrf2 family nitric oxide-sensitive transcriptional repressor
MAAIERRRAVREQSLRARSAHAARGRWLASQVENGRSAFMRRPATRLPARSSGRTDGRIARSTRTVRPNPDRVEQAMKHTNHADYALRVLMYLHVAPGRRGSIGDIAAAHHVSRHHLDKVVQRMVTADLVETTRGRGGGVRLVRDPSTITVGEVIRAMEDDFAVVECLGPARFCRVAGVCGARNVFARALAAYFAVLDEATLDDIAANDQGLRGALNMLCGAARS